MKDSPPRIPETVEAESLLPEKKVVYAHLSEHRRLIVRRALLASALKGFFPVPGVDEILAGKVVAGLYMKLASLRQVDLPAESAAALAGRDPNQGGASAMVTALSGLARFAGRKAFALVAAGRSAAEMTRLFQSATLFDHYAATLHVGGAITSEQAQRLQQVIATCVANASEAAITRAFGDGARVLGRSLLESPRWLANEFTRLAERFLRSGGNAEAAATMEDPVDEADAAWLDKAVRAVEESISLAGDRILQPLIADFEERMRKGP